MAKNTTPALHGTVEDHISTLDSVKKLLPRLTQSPALLRKSRLRPTLWHTDLHMGNIFVSTEDYTRIVSFIDWQFTSISPLFLQARWPIFLEPPERYPQGLKAPKLPDNFNELNAEEKNVALHMKDWIMCSKAYEVATYLNNEDAYFARWNLAGPLRELFLRCGTTWDEGIAPLRECLIQISKDWGGEEILCPDPAPVHFTRAETSSHERQFSEYTQWHEIQHIAKQCLGTDDEGWISPEEDVAAKRSKNKELLALAIKKFAEWKTEDEVRRMWPFPLL